MQGFGLMIEELDAGAVRIALRGELDLAHAYTFDEELRRVEEARPPCVVLDLRELTLPRLVRARPPARRPPARPQGRAPARCSCAGPPTIQRLFALSAVDEAFEMVMDVPVGAQLTVASGPPPA